MKKSEIREILKKLDDIQITLDILKELETPHREMRNTMIWELQVTQGKLVNQLWELI